MNPRDPHDGLSAYFDGELNPSEQSEIERHLQQSSAAQDELTDIRRLSEEIRRLPPASAPHDLLANVMNQIEGNPITPAKVPSRSFSKSLFATGSWVGAAVVVVMVLAWVPTFWRSSEQDDFKSTASHSPKPPATDEATPENPSAPEATPAPRMGNRSTPKMLGSKSELLAQKQAGPALPQADGLAPGADQSRRSVANNSFDLQSQAGKEQGFRRIETGGIGDKKPSTDPQVADVLKLADGHRDDVVVVEITVANAADSMKQLQKLLEGHPVSRTRFQSQFGGGFPGAAGGGRASETQNSSEGLFVQSSREQILEALTSFREQRADASLLAKTTLALSEIPLANENRDRPTRRKMADEIAESLKRSVRQNKPNPGKPSPLPPVPIDPSNVSAEEQAKADAKPAEAQKKLPPVARPLSVAAPDLSKIPRPGIQSRSTKNANETDSFQTPKAEAKDGQLPAAKSPGIQPGEGKPLVRARPESAAATGMAEKAPSRPVRVLFLFREQPPPPKP